MVLVWMACLTTNLQLHERRRHRSFHHGANCIYLWFFSMFWALCLLFIRVIQRPAALRRRSSPSKNVFLWKVFPGCVTGRPHSTTQPSGQCSNLSCPQRAWTQKKKKKQKEKTEIARADPTGRVNLSRLQHRNNRLYLPVESEDRVCAFVHMFKEHRDPWQR